MQLETIIVAQVPRLKYPDGHTELLKVPWADKQSQWTMLFERLAIDLLQACRSLSHSSFRRGNWLTTPARKTQ